MEKETGELHVIGEGEAVIDVALKRGRGYLSRIEEKVKVQFKSEERECTPCVPHGHDKLSWDVVTMHPRNHLYGCKCSKEETYIRIKWSVSHTRTIAWSIRQRR